MKAKEYAKRIVDSVQDHVELEPQDQIDFLIDGIHKVSVDYLKEVVSLIEKRRAMSNHAVAAIFKEQNDKWRAMCRIINRDLKEELLDMDGFKTISKERFPEVYEYMQKNGW